MSWTWQGRRLTKAVKDKTVTYTYDSEGIRTSKSDGTNTTKYLLNGTQILAQTTNGKTLCFFYDQQGNRVGMADSSNHFYYYIYNVQGDVIALADASTGKLAATYTYDAWGKIVKINGENPEDVASTNIANINPFRYRGYYYDAETGLYYLNSRYYDADTGRFISADGFASTNIGGPLNSNTFAYCGNNPVNRADPSGKFFVTALLFIATAIVCAVTISGCSSQPTSDVGSAQPYVDMPGSNDSNSPNCYAYAIGSPTNEQPGGASGRTPSNWSDVKDVGKSVEADLKAKGYSVRKIEGPSSKVYDNEFKIALRVGTKPWGYNPSTGELLYDYHFMRQTNTGQWAEKHGYGGASVLWDPGMTPNTIPWTLGGVPYYDSPIIYYAVGR